MFAKLIEIFYSLEQENTNNSWSHKHDFKLLSNKDQKIFVWAPSNAAVDEIVWRLVSNGLTGSDGAKTKAELVRVGALDYNPPEIVRKHSLDYLVDERMKKSAGKEDSREADEYQRRNNKIELIKEHILNAERTGISYDEFLTMHKQEMHKLYKMMSTEIKKSLSQLN